MDNNVDKHLAAMSTEELKALQKRLSTLVRARQVALRTQIKDERIRQRLREAVMCTVLDAATVLACDAETIEQICKNNEVYHLTLPNGERRIQVASLARCINVRLRWAPNVGA